MRRLLHLALVTAVSAAAPSASAAGSVTKGPWMQHVTSTSAVIRVEIEPPAPVTLEIGLSAALGAIDGGSRAVIESREPRSLHTILVKGLEPATRYPITVRAEGTPRFGAVTTAPSDDSGAPFRFLVYGDNRTDDASHAAVVRAMVGVPSSFLVNTGDLVEHGGSGAQWQAFFDLEAPLTRERPIFAAVGNHELADGAGVEFLRYFGPAELPAGTTAAASSITGVVLPNPDPAKLAPDQLNGTFRWGSARFFLLNGMVSLAASPTRQWLEKVLGDADKEPGLVWRILVVHHGPWSSGPHGGNRRMHEANIPELLRAHKVDVVIAGHDHIYERGVSDGISYLVSGGGGAPLYRVKKPDVTSRRYESARHFIEASVTGVAIQFVATRADGSPIERCALRKNAGWDCDGDDKAGGGVAAARAPSSSAPSAPGSSSRCTCRAAGADGAAGGREPLWAALLGALAAVALRVRRASARSVR